MDRPEPPYYVDLEKILDDILSRYKEPKSRGPRKTKSSRPKASYKSVVKWIEGKISRKLTVPEVCYIMHQCLSKKNYEVKRRLKEFLPVQNGKPVFVYMREIEGLGKVPLFFILLPKNHQDYRVAYRDLFILQDDLNQRIPRLAVCIFCKDPECFVYKVEKHGADEVWSYKCKRKICRIAPHEQRWDPLEQYVDSLGKRGGVIVEPIVNPFEDL
jgi:hypothetical protein